MATDTTVVVAPDSTGAKIDNSAITTQADVAVKRQRTNISDPSDPNAHASVRGEDQRGALGVDLPTEQSRLDSIDETLKDILLLLRMFIDS
jgi:hypothetical protein